MQQVGVLKNRCSENLDHFARQYIDARVELHKRDCATCNDRTI